MKSFIPFIVIGICIGMYFMYISPSYAEMKGLMVKKADYTDALSKADELKEKRKTILAEYESIDPADRERLDRIVPDVTDNVEVVTNINFIASMYGMTVRGIKIAEPQAQDRVIIADASKANSYKTVKITFSVNGPYAEFMKFLTDLESNSRLFDVTSLSIKTKDEKIGIFDYTLEVSAYSLK